MSRSIKRGETLTSSSELLEVSSACVVVAIARIVVAIAGATAKLYQLEET